MTSPWFSPAHPDPGPATPRPARGSAPTPPPVRDGAPEPAVPADPAQANGPLVAFAMGRLAAGRRPEQAFCDLADLGTERRLAAIAVCAAVGTPWELAASRMAAFDGIWPSLTGATAETAGGLLELYGYFDLEVELDHDAEVVASYLRQAMAAVEYLPSGYANQMYRLLRTGRLREALLSLEEMGEQQWPDNLAFWLGLTEVAQRLDTAAILDTEVAAARRRCESRARLG